MTTFTRRETTKGTLLNKKQIDENALELIANVANLPEDANTDIIKNVEAYQIIEEKNATTRVVSESDQ